MAAGLTGATAGGQGDDARASQAARVADFTSSGKPLLDGRCLCAGSCCCIAPSAAASPSTTVSHWATRPLAAGLSSSCKSTVGDTVPRVPTPPGQWALPDESAVGAAWSPSTGPAADGTAPSVHGTDKLQQPPMALWGPVTAAMVGTAAAAWPASISKDTSGFPAWLGALDALAAPLAPYMAQHLAGIMMPSEQPLQSAGWAPSNDFCTPAGRNGAFSASAASPDANNGGASKTTATALPAAGAGAAGGRCVRLNLRPSSGSGPDPMLLQSVEHRSAEGYRNE
eukprot:CAMPEP_0203911864 /NCGR_PEP_ID=MMETSP0359-20131031/52998_1 /ASSEMBLY_ACC=CAM_ASM_000338 /TAXON_ID=268821 /ORGANISM="Scrippsiella Hangoei, Strain SHTV-5" /LENGTH=282 /DNA_ID=CAMNT_0050837665 /DNA_START=54 /DNA_END=903 /DNA_ORIENTATION=-